MALRTVLVLERWKIIIIFMSPLWSHLERGWVELIPPSKNVKVFDWVLLGITTERQRRERCGWLFRGVEFEGVVCLWTGADGSPSSVRVSGAADASEGGNNIK
jgi:hypothetical protein